MLAGSAQSTEQRGTLRVACRSALARIVFAGALTLFATPGQTTAQAQHHFTITAPALSQALIQFSRQSGRSIVFSDRLTRRMRATSYTGTATINEVLDTLLAGSGLTWELVDDRIVAVVEQRCQDSKETLSDCPNAAHALSNYPVYIPGVEETYVYGNRITGSRIRYAQYERSSPVDIISTPDIELSGAQTLGEILKFVPAVAGNSLSTAISNGGDGTSTVTLRGLPASNTLVLINGRRVANNGLAGESVDLNSIPPAAVERIEILKGGASAIYGSDAIAGVVNVIMKQDFHGFLAEGFVGQAEAGDLETESFTFQYGTGIPNGSFFLSASYYDQEPLYSRDRRISANADSRPLGGTDQRSSATPSARVTLPDGQALILDGQNYRPATPEDLFNYQAFTTAVVPLQRASLYSNFSYDFSEQVSGLLEFHYLETDARATLAPTPLFTAFEQVPLPVAADNPYNPFSQEIADVRRRLVEFPERVQRDESEVTRFSAILEGLNDNWHWDLGYNWSRSEATQTTSSLVNTGHLQRGIGPAQQCQGIGVDGCVPINLFGPPGSITQDQLDYLGVEGRVSGYYQLYSLSLNVSNEVLNLRYGRGDLAFGFEYRDESTSKRPSDLIASVGTLGGTNFEPTRGSRQIIELYAETVLPLWQSSSGQVEVALDAAARYSKYSDFGSVTNPKVGLRVELGGQWRLRANLAGGFRAPSLNELYQGNSEEQAFIADPCTLANSTALPGCSAQADPTRNQFLTVTGGNPELEAETAQSWGLGLVWTPSAIPGLTASADYFKIKQDDVVASSAQFIVNQNALFGLFENQITRDPLGNLQLVEANNLNVGSRNVSGVDLALSYHHPQRRWGKLSISGSATYLHEYRSQVDSASPELDLAGTFRDSASEGLGGIPEWKSQIGVQWNRQRWQAAYEIHYVSSLKELIPGSLQTRQVDDWAVHDLQASYTFDVLDGLRWAVGIDNAFDEDAPLAASAFNDNIDGRTHELKGRFWYTKISQRF